MLPNLFNQHGVRDYSVWQRGYDDHLPKRIEAGLTETHLFRDKIGTIKVLILFAAGGLVRNYLATFFFVIFYTSSFAAATELNMQSDNISQTMHSTNDSQIYLSPGYNIYGIIGDFKNYKSEATALEGKDVPIGSIKDFIEKVAFIALLKDGDKVIWSLAPVLNRFTLHPRDDIKNLQVVLRYRF